MADKITQLQKELGTIIKGKKEVTDKIIMAVLARGHVLLEDVPGVGKTTTALALCRLMGMDFNRIQFTPDVVPSDVTGFTMYEKQTGKFIYRPGAVMCNMLPESQLDRFMISLSMGYPDHENLVELLRDRQTTNPLEKATAVITKEEVVMLQDQVQKVYMADSILNYIATLAEATRNHPMITLGLSPRGTLALCRMTKAAAFMEERDYVIPEDVKRVFTDVTAHRMILDSRARYQEQSAKDILEEILKDTPAPKVEG